MVRSGRILLTSLPRDAKALPTERTAAAAHVETPLTGIRSAKPVALHVPSVLQCGFMIFLIKMSLKVRGFGRTIGWIRRRMEAISEVALADLEAITATSAYSIPKLIAFRTWIVASMRPCLARTGLSSIGTLSDSCSFGQLLVMMAGSEISDDPLVASDGSTIGVGLVRPDNRVDVQQTLGLRGRPLTDLQLVLGAVTRHGAKCVAKLLGDFAFVVWNPTTGRSPWPSGSSLWPAWPRRPG